MWENWTSQALGLYLSYTKTKSFLDSITSLRRLRPLIQARSCVPPIHRVWIVPFQTVSLYESTHPITPFFSWADSRELKTFERSISTSSTMTCKTCKNDFSLLFLGTNVNAFSHPLQPTLWGHSHPAAVICFQPSQRRIERFDQKHHFATRLTGAGRLLTARTQSSNQQGRQTWTTGWVTWGNNFLSLCMMMYSVKDRKR